MKWLGKRVCGWVMAYKPVRCVKVSRIAASRGRRRLNLISSEGKKNKLEVYIHYFYIKLTMDIPAGKHTFTLTNHHSHCKHNDRPDFFLKHEDISLMSCIFSLLRFSLGFVGVRCVRIRTPPYVLSHPGRPGPPAGNWIIINMKSEWWAAEMSSSFSQTLVWNLWSTGVSLRELWGELSGEWRAGVVWHVQIYTVHHLAWGIKNNSWA